jgi:hypothetical protein
MITDMQEGLFIKFAHKYQSFRVDTYLAFIDTLKKSNFTYALRWSHIQAAE